MKLTLLLPLLVASAAAQIQFDPPTIPGNVTSSALDEISGAFGLRSPGNEDKLITVHDSDADYMFILNADGSLNSRVNIVGDNWFDAEEIIGYTDAVTDKNYVILCEFGDNPASRDKKYLFRFEEPTVTGSDINITEFTKIAYRLPASPVLEKGANRGDFEGAFADPVDGKIYLFSKRMALNHIYSLPIQDEYIGTQTLTFEGTMHPDVAQEWGGIISPANCVAAAVSRDNNNVLVKTYNKVYQFVRPSGRTWADVLINDAPTVEPNYVGLGAAPAQEPQGESITFRFNDSAYFTVSEYRGYSQVPLFCYGKSGDTPVDPEPPVDPPIDPEPPVDPPVEPEPEPEPEPTPEPNVLELTVDGADVTFVVENLPAVFWIEYTTNLKKWQVVDAPRNITTVGNISTVTFTHVVEQKGKKAKTVFYRIGYNIN